MESRMAPSFWRVCLLCIAMLSVTSGYTMGTSAALGDCRLIHAKWQLSSQAVTCRWHTGLPLPQRKYSCKQKGVMTLRGSTELERLRNNEASHAVVLDFDGVVCDAFNERVRVAYKASFVRWPEVMKQASMIEARDAGVRSSWVGYDWSSYEEDAGNDIPRWLEEKLRQVLPVLNTSAELVLATRLCVSEAIASRKSKERGRRPLTAGEIIENWEEMKDILYLKCDAQESELSTMFDEARQTWQGSDEDEWIDSVEVYPGLAEAIKACPADVFVLTTDMDVNTTTRLLVRKGINVPSDRVMDCRSGRGQPKIDALMQIMRVEKDGKAQWDIVHFVEDQTTTLHQMASDLRLARSVQLHFATWGHSSSRNKAAVAAWPRVRSLSIDALSGLLKGDALP